MPSTEKIETYFWLLLGHIWHYAGSWHKNIAANLPEPILHLATQTDGEHKIWGCWI